MTHAALVFILAPMARRWPVPEDAGYESSYARRCAALLETLPEDAVRRAVESVLAEPFRKSRPTPEQIRERTGVPLPGNAKLTPIISEDERKRALARIREYRAKPRRESSSGQAAAKEFA